MQEIYAANADRVFRLACLYLKNRDDAEDVVQDVFVKLIRQVRVGKEFESTEHEKAWLLVTAANECKNRLRRKSRGELNLEDFPQLAAPNREYAGLLDAVLALPVKYRSVIYLYYYEGYRSEEIAGMLRERPATVRTWLSRARKQLKKDLGGEFFD